MSKKTAIILITGIIIICIGIITIIFTKSQNENVMNQIEYNNELNQEQQKENDLNNNNSKVKDYGIITNIEKDIITIQNKDVYQVKIDKNTRIIKYRTAEDMN